MFSDSVNLLFTVITQELTPVLKKSLVMKRKKKIRKDYGWLNATKDELKACFALCSLQILV